MAARESRPAGNWAASSSTTIKRTLSIARRSDDGGSQRPFGAR